MLRATLRDLDELALTIRNPVSAAYTGEAIRAYQSRAYRAAIVSTWVAVVYDCLSKIRELATLGDAPAAAFVLVLDSAITHRNLRKLQEIENDLLETAKRQFEFLTEREYADMGRLREDRHACVHPAFVTEGRLFDPGPDLVRTHLVHAIQHVLSQQPLQGKALLARLKSDLMQPSFPPTLEAVERYVDATYIRLARPSLVETVVTVLLKALLRQAEPDLIGHEEAVLNCLIAVGALCPELYEAKMAEQLPGMIDSLSDQEMRRAFPLLASEHRCWGWVSGGARIRIPLVVENCLGGGTDTTDVVALIRIEELRGSIQQAVRNLHVADQMTVISRNPCPEFAEDAVRLFALAGSYRGAEELGHRVLLPVAPFLNRQQVAEVLATAGSNSQIYYAGEMPSILARFFDRTERFHGELTAMWQELLQSFVAREEDPDGYFGYPVLRGKMERKKMWPP